MLGDLQEQFLPDPCRRVGLFLTEFGVLSPEKIPFAQPAASAVRVKNTVTPQISVNGSRPHRQPVANASPESLCNLSIGVSRPQERRQRGPAPPLRGTRRAGGRAAPGDAPPSQKDRQFGCAKHPGVTYTTLSPLLRVRLINPAKRRPGRHWQPPQGGRRPRARSARVRAC